MTIKDVLTRLIWNEIGPELKEELEAANCVMQIADDYGDYTYTNLTPELQAKIDAKKQESLDMMEPEST
ncbi:hypothetical protein [Mucilaginibacter ginsenosidivorans]|uniref:Uncharacterized protein n=1 Tax=Mucilaginibacter ginsenosidivorans TaxID=398053 RepID=A0A5B8US55_9SPHI|nr:hypothetical protein [Mucilaginibacter ginsenosidivorans]QEC61732.1 hypothetical protein FRZ54_03745 [Mucilaginibacter ginsenosidivorans]